MNGKKGHTNTTCEERKIIKVLTTSYLPVSHDIEYMLLGLFERIVLLINSLPPNDILQVPLPNVARDSPGAKRMPLRKDFLDLLERALCRLGETKGKVDRGSKVECSEQKVRLPRDVGQARRNGPGERKIEEPVCRGRERDCLGAHLHGEDLCGVCPRDRSNGDGKGADTEVRTHDDGLGHWLVVRDDPDGSIVDAPPLSISTLETADKAKEEAHEC